MAITVPGEFHEASSRGRLIDRAQRTPLDSTLGHIRSRDNFQEEPRPATHGPQSPVSAQAHIFLQFIWHGNRRSTGLQRTSASAMASI